MSPRTSHDRCPGVLRPHPAADGSLVRVRRPGGRFSAETLLALARLATTHGAPFLQLTSRGNLQIRGLSDPLPEDFVSGVNALGLLPSRTHERVRNIVAAPAPELDDLVSELDAQLQRDPALANLPGRWLFVVADETGDGLELPYDVAYQALSPTTGRVWCAGETAPCRSGDAISVLLDLANRFLVERAAHGGAGVWNIRDLPSGTGLLTNPLGNGAQLGPLHDDDYDTNGKDEEIAHRHRTGSVQARGWGARSVGVPLGLLSLPQVEALRSLGDDLVVTPHRSIVVRDAEHGTDPHTADRIIDDKLVAVGLEPGGLRSTMVTACIGAPFCRRTTSPTVELTRQALQHFTDTAPRTHVVGCDRACGAPATDHVLVTAPTTTDDILTAAGLHD